MKFLRTWRHAASLWAVAKALAAMPQGKTQMAWNELETRPPLLPSDQARLQDIFDHPEDYTHLHPQGHTLAEVAFAEMGIQTAVAQLTARPHTAPSNEEMEALTKIVGFNKPEQA